jgi:glycosyltransferase involved in cell wall biosynthesis
MKLLLSAYTCRPSKISEPGCAWRTIDNALACNHEVWAVIEQAHDAAAIESYLAQHPMPLFHPVFVKLALPLEMPLQNRGRAGMLESVYYHLWQQKLLRVARELHQRVGFDLAHHITYGRYWSPSGVRNLNIPFVWGPVGAAEVTPSAFVSELPLHARCLELVRDKMRALAQENRALRDTAWAVTIGLGCTRESCAALRALGVRRVEELPPPALSDDEMAFFDNFPPPPPGPFRAICIGRLVHWKGFHLAIRAFGIFARNEPEAELWIVNDGPFRRELEQTAAQAGIQSRVRFLGYLPTYEDVLGKLAQAHVLLHPALHEGYGNATREALAAGRPVVCIDIGGPAAQVTPETGFVAPATTPDEAVVAMASFLTNIAGDRPRLATMSAAARARARENFTMRRIGPALDSFYHQAVALHAQSPPSPRG